MPRPKANATTGMTHGRDYLLEVPPRPAVAAPDECGPGSAPASDPAPVQPPEPFDTFLQQHYPALVQFLRHRTPSEQDAQDAAQESLARLLRYRESEPASAWRPLLFRIATNVAHDQLRHAQVQRQRAQLPPEEQDPAALGGSEAEPSPEQRLADQQQLALVLSAIRHLPDKCRHIFLLSRFPGMSTHTIALRCGISVRMVEKQITKALAACRTRVRDYGG